MLFTTPHNMTMRQSGSENNGHLKVQSYASIERKPGLLPQMSRREAVVSNHMHGPSNKTSFFGSA